VERRLLKMERQTKDAQAGGREVAEEHLYSDYQESDGMRRAGKIRINRDGKLYVEAETVDFQPLEKLDASVFARP